MSNDDDMSDIVDKMVADRMQKGFDYLEIVGNPSLDADVSVLQQCVDKGFSISIEEGNSIVVDGEVVHMTSDVATVYLNKCTVMCAEQPCGYFASASETVCEYHFDYEALGGSENYSTTVLVEGRLLETFASLTRQDREEIVCNARKCQKVEAQDWLTRYQQQLAAFTRDKCDTWTREKLVSFLREQPQRRIKELVLLNWESTYFKDMALLNWTSTKTSTKTPSSKKLKRQREVPEAAIQGKK